ncbi:hypothetical protein LR48_Vigan205s005000 [Vigna angularis]|uniref:Uncharacterized protein n=1 Tax=Phaseolus angularis TaxID=3914 RepID=A0A0L9T5Q8_PHAAN|nr:hypothetical protein LR48_Vigan205s005000 [Vigna angularis]
MSRVWLLNCKEVLPPQGAEIGIMGLTLGSSLIGVSCYTITSARTTVATYSYNPDSQVIVFEGDECSVEQALEGEDHVA